MRRRRRTSRPSATGPSTRRFSYITSREANEAFYSESQFIGFGLSTAVSGLEMRVTQVFPESPASEAGLSRGDRIVEIGGRLVAALISSGEIGSAFGPSEIGVETDVVFVNQAGTRREAHMVKRLVTIPTVSLTRVYNVGGRRIGYIFFRNFVEPSVEALDSAFAELSAAGVDELVLDLRYNGGGLVNVAQHLASYIGGVGHGRPGVRRVLPQRQERVPQSHHPVRDASRSGSGSIA